MWKPQNFQADPKTHWLKLLFAPRDDPGPPALPPPVSGWLYDRWRAWFSPIGRLEGCWLEGVVTMGNSHSKLGARLVRLQLAMEQAVAKRRLAFQVLPSASSWDCDLVWLNALSQHGLALLPEILGITLAHAKADGGVFNLDHSVRYQKVEQAAKAVFPLVAEPERVEAGQAFYHRLSHTWLAAWQALAGDLRRQVLWLLKEKARYGVGHHGRIRLAGRILDDWLKEIAEGEGEKFLKAFLNSPKRDQFFQAMRFGGAMFGVFSQTEQELLRTWLHWEETGESATPPCLAPTAEAQRRFAPALSAQPDWPGRLSARQLYHQLLNLERFPACLPAAKRYVQAILKRAQAKPPFLYSQAAFYRWVEEVHAEQNLAGQAVKPTLSRAACRFGIEQLAPAVLVDGAWLARSLRLKRCYPEVGQRLWQIFRDEVGDGVSFRNHANVYRRLLEQAGIELPLFDSQAFIHHPGFIACAFDLPAFLLAIGQFPEEFLAELLGLNLAIELSGLGRTYQRLIFELESCGLDATIVRLHQSIDNLASGHAALARDAILCYLERLAAGGEDLVQTQWQRIFTGYRAFAFAYRRFTLTFALYFGIRFWLGDKIVRLKA